MHPLQIVALLLLSAYAVYRQSVPHEVVGSRRFKLALIYAVVGLVVGGFYLPPDRASWVGLVVGVVASTLVGVARGKLTKLSRRGDGVVVSQGTALTIALFVGLVAAKFGWGAWEYVHGAHPHGGFGEVLVLIAAMVAMQSEIVWRRAVALGAASAPVSPKAGGPAGAATAVQPRT